MLNKMIPSPIVSPVLANNILTIGWQKFFADLSIYIGEATGFRAKRATAQSIPNGVWTILQTNTEDYDLQGEYSTTNYKFTAKYTGVYIVSGAALSASVAWTAGEIWVTAVYKNGVMLFSGYRNEAFAAHTGQMHSVINSMVQLAAGDYLTLMVYHNQGAAVNTLNDASVNYFAAHLVDK